MRTSTASMAGDSLAGVRALFRRRRLRALLLLGWLPPMFAVVPEAVAVPYSAAQGDAPSGAGVLLGSVAAGVIVGELVVARLPRPSARRRWMSPLALSMSMPPLLFVLRPALPVAAVLLLLSGLGWSYGLARSQLLLDALPPDLRGRGLTLDGSGVMLTQAAGFTIGGAAAQWLAPHDAIAVAAVAGLVVTGLCLRAVRGH